MGHAPRFAESSDAARPNELRKGPLFGGFLEAFWEVLQGSWVAQAPSFEGEILKMDRRGLLLLGLARASVVPSGVAPAAWPLGTATAAESNTSWRLGVASLRPSGWSFR